MTMPNTDNVSECPVDQIFICFDEGATTNYINISNEEGKCDELAYPDSLGDGSFSYQIAADEFASTVPLWVVWATRDYEFFSSALQIEINICGQYDLMLDDPTRMELVYGQDTNFEAVATIAAAQYEAWFQGGSGTPFHSACSTITQYNIYRNDNNGWKIVLSPSNPYLFMHPMVGFVGGAIDIKLGALVSEYIWFIGATAQSTQTIYQELSLTIEVAAPDCALVNSITDAGEHVLPGIAGHQFSLGELFCDTIGVTTDDPDACPFDMIYLCGTEALAISEPPIANEDCMHVPCSEMSAVMAEQVGTQQEYFLVAGTSMSDLIVSDPVTLDVACCTADAIEPSPLTGGIAITLETNPDPEEIHLATYAAYFTFNYMMNSPLHSDCTFVSHYAIYSATTMADGTTSYAADAANPDVYMSTGKLIVERNVPVVGREAYLGATTAAGQVAYQLLTVTVEDPPIVCTYTCTPAAMNKVLDQDMDVEVGEPIPIWQMAPMLWTVAGDDGDDETNLDMSNCPVEYVWTTYHSNDGSGDELEYEHTIADFALSTSTNKYTLTDEDVAAGFLQLTFRVGATDTELPGRSPPCELYVWICGSETVGLTDPAVRTYNLQTTAVSGEPYLDIPENVFETWFTAAAADGSTDGPQADCLLLDYEFYADEASMLAETPYDGAYAEWSPGGALRLLQADPHAKLSVWLAAYSQGYVTAAQEVAFEVTQPPQPGDETVTAKFRTDAEAWCDAQSGACTCHMEKTGPDFTGMTLVLDRTEEVAVHQFVLSEVFTAGSYLPDLHGDTEISAMYPALALVDVAAWLDYDAEIMMTDDWEAWSDGFTYDLDTDTALLVKMELQWASAEIGSNRIPVTVVVCGGETISFEAASGTLNMVTPNAAWEATADDAPGGPAFTWVVEAPTNMETTWSAFRDAVSFDVPADASHGDCVSAPRLVWGLYEDEDALDAWTDTAKVEMNGDNDIVVKSTTYWAPTTLYVAVTTRGLVWGVAELNLEITCGAETVSAVSAEAAAADGISFGPYLQHAKGSAARVVGLSGYLAFTVDTPDCPVESIEIVRLPASTGANALAQSTQFDAAKSWTGASNIQDTPQADGTKQYSPATDITYAIGSAEASYSSLQWTATSKGLATVTGTMEFTVCGQETAGLGEYDPSGTALHQWNVTEAIAQAALAVGDRNASVNNEHIWTDPDSAGLPLPDRIEVTAVADGTLAGEAAYYYLSEEVFGPWFKAELPAESQAHREKWKGCAITNYGLCEDAKCAKLGAYNETAEVTMVESQVDDAGRPWLPQCGKEKPAVVSPAPETLTLKQSTAFSYAEIAQTKYAAWFSLAANGASASCTIDKYDLYESATATTPMSRHDTTKIAKMGVAAGSPIEVNARAAFAETTIYLQAQTRGGQSVRKELRVAVLVDLEGQPESSAFSHVADPDAWAASLASKETVYSSGVTLTPSPYTNEYTHYDEDYLYKDSDRKRFLRIRIDYVYEQEVFVAAATQGYRFGTRRVTVAITCGRELLTSAYEQPELYSAKGGFTHPGEAMYNFTATMMTGKRSIPADDVAKMFANTMPTTCPVERYETAPYENRTEAWMKENGLAGSIEYDPLQPDEDDNHDTWDYYANFTVNSYDLYIDTDEVPWAGAYFVDVIAYTVSGVSARSSVNFTVDEPLDHMSALSGLLEPDGNYLPYFPEALYVSVQVSWWQYHDWDDEDWEDADLEGEDWYADYDAEDDDTLIWYESPYVVDDDGDTPMIIQDGDTADYEWLDVWADDEWGQIFAWIDTELITEADAGVYTIPFSLTDSREQADGGLGLSVPVFLTVEVIYETGAPPEEEELDYSDIGGPLPEPPPPDTADYAVAVIEPLQADWKETVSEEAFFDAMAAFEEENGEAAQQRATDPYAYEREQPSTITPDDLSLDGRIVIAFTDPMQVPPFLDNTPIEDPNAAVTTEGEDAARRRRLRYRKPSAVNERGLQAESCEDDEEGVPLCEDCSILDADGVPECTTLTCEYDEDEQVVCPEKTCEIDEDGVEICSFEEGDDEAGLMTLDSLDVARDIFKVDIIVNSDENVNAIQFYLLISRWDEMGLDVFINFTTPQLVSKGRMMDEVQLAVRNPYLFRRDTGHELHPDSLAFKSQIPAQLPKGVNADELEQQAASVASMLGCIGYIQMGLQPFLKGGAQDLANVFFIIQMLVYISMYHVPIPAIVVMYLEEFRKLINFEMVSPDSLLAYVNEEWSVEYFKGKVEEHFGGYRDQAKKQFDRSLEASGVKSGDIVLNMQTFLFFGVAALCAMICLGFIAVFKSRIQKKILAKYQGVIRGMFFNGKIKGFHVTYMVLAVSYAGMLYELDFSDFENRKSEILADCTPLLYHIAYPPFACLVMILLRPKLAHPFTRAKIGNMYEGVHLTRHRWTILFWPMWLYRRFAFVFIPALLPDLIVPQIQALIMSNLFYAMYYGATLPQMVKVSCLLNLTSEWFLLILCSLTFCFTTYLDDEMLKHEMGMNFVYVLCMMLFCNVGNMVRNSVKRYLSGRRKKKTQMAYVKAFKAYFKYAKEAKEKRQEYRRKRRAELLEQSNTALKAIADLGLGIDEEENDFQSPSRNQIRDTKTNAGPQSAFELTQRFKPPKLGGKLSINSKFNKKRFMHTFNLNTIKEEDEHIDTIQSIDKFDGGPSKLNQRDVDVGFHDLENHGKQSKEELSQFVSKEIDDIFSSIEAENKKLEENMTKEQEETQKLVEKLTWVDQVQYNDTLESIQKLLQLNQEILTAKFDPMEALRNNGLAPIESEDDEEMKIDSSALAPQQEPRTTKKLLESIKKYLKVITKRHGGILKSKIIKQQRRLFQEVHASELESYELLQNSKDAIQFEIDTEFELYMAAIEVQIQQHEDERDHIEKINGVGIYEGIGAKEEFPERIVFKNKMAELDNIQIPEIEKVDLEDDEDQKRAMKEYGIDFSQTQQKLLKDVDKDEEVDIFAKPKGRSARRSLKKSQNPQDVQEEGHVTGIADNPLPWMMLAAAIPDAEVERLEEQKAADDAEANKPFFTVEGLAHDLGKMAQDSMVWAGFMPKPPDDSDASSSEGSSSAGGLGGGEDGEDEVEEGDMGGDDGDEPSEESQSDDAAAGPRGGRGRDRDEGADDDEDERRRRQREEAERGQGAR